MAKKRNTNAAIKALKRKRHNKTRANYEAGGRVQKFYGGPLNLNLDGGNYSSTAEPVMDGGGRGPAGNNTQQTSTTEQTSTPDPTPPPDFGTGTEPYTPPKAEIVKAGQVVDYTAIADQATKNASGKFNDPSVGPVYSYDPETGNYIQDNSSFGFTGDAARKVLTPEEFYEATQLKSSDFMISDPSLQTSEEDIQQVTAPTDVTADTVTADTITAETATAEEAQMPGGFDAQNVARAFAEKTGLKYKISSDGTIRFQDGQGNTFTRSPEDLVQEFNLEGDFGTSLKAQTYQASQVGDVGKTEVAEGTIEEDSGALAKVDPIKGLTQEAEAVTMTQQEMEALKGTAATRPEAENYATGVTADERFTVLEATDPEVAQRMLTTISEREKQDILNIVSKEGVNLDDIPEFKVAATRTAQVGAAQRGIAIQLGEAPSVDLEGREAITGTAPQGDASQIGGIPTMAASSMQAVTGEARTAAAADMMAVVGNMPPEVTAAISEDPATVEAQLDTGEDPQVVAAVAALPQEALVSVQMENLLAGMEDGKTPAWARPAVAAIEQQMAARGLSASTVGRDALFNAIIQSALPIAQSNAQALQQRASQNLNNEQQANLASAQNIMQVRIQNLANRQTAASQTADMAQQIKVQQGQFKQQAKMTTADQQQQTRLQNIQNAQQQASQESAQRQQTALANLDAGSRMDLANLEAMNLAGKENLNAEQQTKLANYKSKVDRIMRQAELEQDMEKANLDSSLRMEMLNLSEQNAAAKDTMTAENEERLANLNVLVDFKKTNASFAQQMELANLNNAQQMELANLAEKAATDAANVSEANRMQLQEYVTYVDVMSKNEQLRQNAELAQLSAAEKMSLANMTAANQADSENMTAENMAELQVYEKKMAAAQTNAQLAQQMGLANLSNEQAASMFNAQIDANMDMKQFDANQQMALANSKFMQTATLANLNNNQQAAMQNATAMANLDLATVDQNTKLAVQNAQAFLQMDMANLANEQQANILDQQNKQQRMLSNQAADNAAAQFNATSENQTQQFMASMEANMSQFNTAQTNAMTQFNTAETNRIAAQNAGNQLAADQANAQITADVGKFNAQMDAQAEQWNAANAQAIEQSNLAWRRSANTAETAAQNAVNQQQAAFQFEMDRTTQAQMWQQMRDQAAFDFQEGQADEDRMINVVNAALQNEAFMTDKNFAGQRQQLFNMLSRVTGQVGTGG